MQNLVLPEETRPITEEEEVALGFPSRRGMLDLDVYSISDVAERLDITEMTVKAHIKSGRLKAIKFGGAIGYKVLRQHIYEWLINMQTDLLEQDLTRPATRGSKNLSNGSK